MEILDTSEFAISVDIRHNVSASRSSPPLVLEVLFARPRQLSSRTLSVVSLALPTRPYRECGCSVTDLLIFACIENQADLNLCTFALT